MEVKPTRSELLEIKKKIKLTKSGYKILKMKRDGLILEFFKILEQAKQVREKVDQGLRAGHGEDRHGQGGGRRHRGPVRRLRPEDPPGDHAAHQERHGPGRPGDRGQLASAPRWTSAVTVSSAPPSTSTRPPRPSRTWSRRVIEAAEIETTMKKLLEEIEKTKRRVNALEFKVIPELQEAEAFIGSVSRRWRGRTPSG